MENMYKQHGNKLYWTEEKCLEVAMSCDTIKEFSTKYTTAYIKSITKGWRKNYTWLKRTVITDTSTPNYIIYAYEDVSEKVCYVGLTNNILKRKSQHKKTRYYKDKNGIKHHYRDTPNKYFFEKGEVLPEPKILQTNLNAEQAQVQEKYWCDVYANKGWHLLNKAKTGKNSSSLGGCQIKWTYDVLKLEAKKYKTKEEFKRLKNSAYKVARENGFLDSFFPSAFENIPDEKWLDIEEYYGLYQISNFKRVKHLKDANHKTERLVSIFTKRGKQMVSLYKNNKAKIIPIDNIYNKAWKAF